MDFELAFIAALIIDLILGDPRWLPHPVRLIGWLCCTFETLFRRVIRPEKIAGTVTAVSVILTTTGGTVLALYVFQKFSPFLQICASIFIIYSLIAIKDLLVHSRRVYNCLFPVEHIRDARTEVAKIVGRDTSTLNQEGICRACVETVAENMVDGITAPIFWAVLATFLSFILPLSPLALAAAGMTFYKTVNTMDSMFGYKNSKYLNFGWFAARLDDWMNFVPARLSGGSVVFGAFLSRRNWRTCLEILQRDRLNHSSPNAGHTEAAVAGLLGIQLGGNSLYFGKEVLKPTMGEKIYVISPYHILQTHQIVLLSSSVFLFSVLLLRWLIFDLLVR